MSTRRMLAAIGLGAGLMYLLDPQRGRRRRALMRDQVVGLRTDMEDGLSKGVRDLNNWTQGMVAEGESLFSGGPVPDEVLIRRVKSRIGWSVSHPSAIGVEAENGHVTLYGPVLADEVDSLLSRVKRVRGVKSVSQQLDVYQEPGNVPGLQGGAEERRKRVEGMRQNWPPRWRLLGSLVGSTLLVSGFIRGGFRGAVSSLFGLGLLARSTTNKPVQQLVGIEQEQGIIDVQKAINIDAPVDEVFDFWRDFENLPRFMGSVRSIKDLGDGRSHWVVEGPGGLSIEWDGHVTSIVPDKEIAWVSEPGSMVYTEGTVHFSPVGDGRTRIDVRISYTPPAGILGHAVATLFGTNPKQQLDADLVHLKSLIEEGKTTAHGETVEREEVVVHA